jgi:hypothetical protein
MTNTTTAATQFTISYEQKTCGRCGGSGSYSYCTMHGTRCFGCGGTGKKISAAGARAHKAIADFKAEHFSKLAEELSVGDRIVIDGQSRTIAEIQTSGGSRYGVKNAETGETEWKDYVQLTLTRPVRSAFGDCSSHGFCQGTRVQLAVGGADFARVVEFARTIRKGVIITAK